MTVSRIFWEWLFLAIEDTIDNLVLADQAIIRSDQIRSEQQLAWRVNPFSTTHFFITYVVFIIDKNPG